MTERKRDGMVRKKGGDGKEERKKIQKERKAEMIRKDKRR
jgi:hypothetical protein